MPINMEHCRFYNTRIALQECQEILDAANGSLPKLSCAEQKEALELIDICCHIARNYGDMWEEN